MKHWSFEANVTLKGRRFIANYEFDADNLKAAYDKAKEYFGGKFEDFEIFGYSLLWENE